MPDFSHEDMAGSRFEDVDLARARFHRMAIVRGVIAGLTDEKLAAMTGPVTGPGYPEPGSYPARRCLGTILSEEWEHRLYAERDFGQLAARPS